MSWEFWIENHDKPEKTPINEPIHATIEEIETHILQRSSLLNGQIRGPINAKGREENLELIIITMSSIFEDGYKLGFEDGKSKKLTNEVKEAN